MLDRSRSLQIYLKPGIKEDALMLRVWEACRKHDRPQDVFRSILRAGLLAMLESGEMPESVIEECGLDALIERRRNRKRRMAEAGSPPQPMPMPVPYAPYAYPQAPHPQPLPPWNPPAPVSHPDAAAAATAPQQPESSTHKAAVADLPKPQPASPQAATGQASGGAETSARPAGDGNRPKGRIGNLM